MISRVYHRVVDRLVAYLSPSGHGPESVASGNPGFDETQYLLVNPDVEVAVREGAFASGWEHYLIYGRNEGRRLRDDPDDVTEDGGLPIPPARLRRRVHGADDTESFLRIGRIVASDIVTLVGDSVSQSRPLRILDFGCGCGRVMRFLYDTFPHADFSGSDIDPEAIAWCQSNLRGTFHVNEPAPPTRYPDGCFHLIYAISVLTHLPEDLGTAWIAELHRITAPGGCVLLTTHGEEHLGDITAEERARFLSHGFHYVARGTTPGLPDFYQQAFHTEAYIRDRWSRWFEIRAVVKRGIAGYQDAIVCRRPM